MGKKAKGNRGPKADKFLNMVKEAEDQVFEGRPSDIVIPIMGATGVGKSSFINSLLPASQARRMGVGHSLASCTTNLVPVELPFSNLSRFDLAVDHNNGNAKRRLIVVDTPGFDDTFVDDSEILRRISVWLASSYNQNMKLAGVIYLHDISQTRMLGTTRRNLDMFTKLVGHDALKSVVLGTTKWDKMDHGVAAKRQSELETTYWKEMRAAGSKVFKITNAKGESAQDIIDGILRRMGSKNFVEHILKIQEDIVELQKFIPETEAGKTLRYTLDEAIKIQKAKAQELAAQAGAGTVSDGELEKQIEQGNERIKNLLRSAKDMKVPFSARIKRFFM